jgi:SPP1 gp7 family putative phage head morphogenesis protein
MVNPFAWFKKDNQIDKDLKDMGKPSERELAASYDSIFFRLDGAFEHYNPDELIQRKGHKIYRKMLRDDQVKAVYNLLINIIISREHIFEKQSDDPIQNEVSDFFEHNIKISIQRTWLSALRTVLLGKAQGYSISEKIWQIEEIDGREWWTIKQIKTKPYETFSFDIDDFGNIRRLLQQNESSSKRLDINKFIIYVANPELDPIWGESDLRAAYRPYWEKDVIGKFWNIWIERIAGGFTVIKPSQDAPNLSPGEKQDLNSLVRNIQKMTAVRLPVGYELDNFNAEDTSAFEQAIGSKNRGIARSILVPNLLGFSEEGKFGSRALGDVQFKMFMQLVKEQGDYLAEVMNEQFFAQLAWWNFGIKDYPRYKFENFSIEERRKIADAWNMAVNNGTVLNTFEDESRTRELLLYPQREESEEEPPPDTVQKPEEEEVIGQSDCRHFVEGENQQSFVNRINFQELQKVFENNQAAFSADMAVSVDEMMNEVKSTMRAEFKDVPTDRDKIDYTEITKSIEKSIDPKTKSDLNKKIQKNLSNAYAEGRDRAKQTIEKTLDKAPEDIKKKVKLSVSLSKRSATKDENWSIRHFVEGINLETAENFFKSKSFMITGDITQDILSAAGQILTNGIRDEKNIREIVIELEDVLPTLVGTRDETTGKINKANRARIENIARTNITTVFTQAQLAVYSDPDLGDFVEAYEYSAIIDSRTTVFCRTYDNRIYSKNDPIWETLTPPNHYQCRSVLIPVTVLDEWKPSKIVTSVQPQKGFGGTIKK